MRSKVLIYKEMRPAVASYDGESPLRGSAQKGKFKYDNGQYEDQLGYRVSKEQMVAC